MRCLVIYNPAAGKKGAYRGVREQIRRYCQKEGIDLEEAVTQFPGHAEKIAEAAARTGEPGKIYGVGGDGTLCEIAGAAAGRNHVQVGIFPVGSGNDYIRTFGSQERFLQVEAQMKAQPVKVDMIQTEKMLSLNLCSAGLDAAVALHMAKFKKLPLVSGPMAYNLALVKCVLGKMGNDLKVTIDGHPPIQDRFLFALAGSGRYYGGGFMPVAEARMDDGVLNTLVVKKVSRTTFLRFVTPYAKGQYYKFPHVARCSTPKVVHIHSDKPDIVTCLDGECITSDDVTIRLADKRLNFFGPAGCDCNRTARDI